MPERAAESANSIPTLEDVAKRSGVSTATVSRCLNSPERVSADTRKRVNAAIGDLGYAPNFGARVLAANRTNTFGAIIPTMESAIFARGLQAFQEELHLHGITLLVASSSYQPEMEEEQVRTLVARGADALLLIGHDRMPQTYRFLEQRRIPHVVAWVHEPHIQPPSIGFDNRRAMKALTEQVIGLGHRTLAYISANRTGNDRARLRVEGALEAMRDHGLDPRSMNIIETPYSISNGATAFQNLLKAEQRPTAILCGNDVLAAGALMMAKELGISVPDDISVTGFDDIEIAEIVSPRLTTVHVPHSDMGRGAARLLLAMRGGETASQSVRLDTSVILRESLGPPP